jgi:hypothetical protein
MYPPCGAAASEGAAAGPSGPGAAQGVVGLLPGGEEPFFAPTGCEGVIVTTTPAPFGGWLIWRPATLSVICLERERARVLGSAAPDGWDG